MFDSCVSPLSPRLLIERYKSGNLTTENVRGWKKKTGRRKKINGEQRFYPGGRDDRVYHDTYIINNCKKAEELHLF